MELVMSTVEVTAESLQKKHVKVVGSSRTAQLCLANDGCTGVTE